jgi:hypothetical protein
MRKAGRGRRGVPTLSGTPRSVFLEEAFPTASCGELLCVAPNGARAFDLLVAEGFDGVEARGAGGGIESSTQADE